jgi:hypothetical protein
VRPQLASPLAVLAAVSLLAAGCAGSSGAKPPPWLVKNAKAMAERLGDPGAKVSYVLGPFPIAVLQGHLTCSDCPRPDGAASPKGSVAASRYDAHTRDSTELVILHRGHGGVRQAISAVCRGHGPSCRHGAATPAKVLLEGVSFGPNRLVTHYSDAHARSLTASTLKSWRKAIRTRAERWPQYHWPNARTGKTDRALYRLSLRYDFSIDRIVWHRPKQLAPEIVVTTTHYAETAQAVPELVSRVLTGYEGYYFEADDERGVPFLYVSRYLRGPSGGGRSWGRSDAVQPFIHL